MKKIFVYMASAALVFAASCNKIEEANTPVDTPAETELITVELNPQTKTSLKDMSTVWTAGDKVNVTVGEEVIGTLTLVSGSTFEGTITAGLDGETVVTLNYPAGVTEVPATQEAKAGSFANGAALLEGTTTVADLRANEGATLENTTALLQFSVAQAGDVTFEVGTTEYTVTGCKTGETYYACVAPATAAFTARIDGYLSKQAAKNVTFTANKIANLGVLPAPEVCEWYLVGQHQGWNLNSSSVTPLYEVEDNLFVARNLNLSDTGFKLTQKNNTNWDNVFGSHSGSYKYTVGTDGWYTGLYTNNRGDKSNDIKLSNWSGPFDVYIRYVQVADWGKELGFAIVKTGAAYPAY